MDSQKISTLDAKGVIAIYHGLKEHNLEDQRDEQEVDEEQLDAFQALGGGPGVEGHVSRTHLMGIMKEQFDIMGINELLECIESGEEEIDFEAFSQLFSDEESGDNSTLRCTRRTFLSAVHSVPSQDSFQVKYSDFLDYCCKNKLE